MKVSYVSVLLKTSVKLYKSEAGELSDISHSLTIQKIKCV